MPVFPTGTAARVVAAPLEASPATSQTATLLPGHSGHARSPETAREADETRSRREEWRRKQARARKRAAGRSVSDEAVLRALESVFALDEETGAAYDDLNHALLLAKERGQEVPCVGPGSELWLSDDYEDQQLAADRCWDCPAIRLCKGYADLAKVSTGTWGGETRDHARRLSDAPGARRFRDLKAQQARGAGFRADRPEPVGRDCRCRCGGTTRGGRYLPGHDSQHLSELLIGVRGDHISLDAALAEVADSERLQAKLLAWLGR